MNGNSRRTMKDARDGRGMEQQDDGRDYTSCTKEERKSEGRTREERRGRTLLEINRNVTIFQQPLPVPRASFSGIFPRSVPRVPTRPSLVSLSPSPPRRYAGKNRDTRVEGGYVCRALEKNSERDSNGGGKGAGRYVPTRERNKW